jgi:hypothetical protein
MLMASRCIMSPLYMLLMRPLMCLLRLLMRPLMCLLRLLPGLHGIPLYLIGVRL